MLKTDEHYMSLALREAERAAALDEVPVGAVVVDADGRVIARAHNLRESMGDPTAHAEILALRRAAKKLSALSHQQSAISNQQSAKAAARLCSADGSKLKAESSGRWRLTGCTLYVTLEPCPMCAGALVNARLPRLVYGCADPKAGACGTLMDVARDPRLNHRVDVTAGVLAAECAAALRDFFSAKRKKKRGRP